jgi:16S rRNA (guanine1207-N2)-methyltransferase
MPHYFDRTPAAPSRPGRLELVLPDWRAELATDRGVFSASAVDAGTLDLLRLPAPAPPDGAQLLDLGCGYGPIGLTLAHRHPAAVVWAVDVNERAVELTRANAEALGLTNVRAVAPGEVPDGLGFEQIWSNPPIRIGKAALHELLQAWLARLAPAGRARLVVHKHLGSDSLAAWLRTEGYSVDRLGSKHGYRILEVER